MSSTSKIGSFLFGNRIGVQNGNSEQESKAKQL